MALDHGKADAFIFDLDGTLLDTVPDLVVLTNTVLTRLGRPERTREEIVSFVGDGVRPLLRRSLLPADDDATVTEAVSLWKDLYLEYGTQLTAPYPGIPALLSELRERGCALAVLSNKFDAGARQIIDQCLPETFSVVHGEREGIPRKPDPTGLMQTMDELGADPRRTAYIGDSPRDVLTAHGAATCGIGVAWGYHRKEELSAVNPDLVLDEPMSLISWAFGQASPESSLN